MSNVEWPGHDHSATSGIMKKNNISFVSIYIQTYLYIPIQISMLYNFGCVAIARNSSMLSRCTIYNSI